MTKAPFVNAIVGMPLVDISDEHENRVEKPFATPADVKMFAGEGADVEDLKRGYLKPDIRNAPEYEKVNYNGRASVVSSENYAEDYQFRDKDRVYSGLLSRSRYPDKGER